MDAATIHIDAASAHMATVAAHMAHGTIKAPFEPTATAPEKMAKQFLNSSFGNRVNCLEKRVKVSREPDKLLLNFFCSKEETG